ncbi:unnamed protein product, partial [Ectocarpus sp. 13 AM-2016]
YAGTGKTFTLRAVAQRNPALRILYAAVSAPLRTLESVVWRCTDTTGASPVSHVRVFRIQRYFYSTLSHALNRSRLPLLALCGLVHCQQQQEAFCCSASTSAPKV